MSERSKLAEATRDAFLVIDALPSLPKSDVDRAAKDLAELVSRECGAKTTTFLLDEQTDKIDW